MVKKTMKKTVGLSAENRKIVEALRKRAIDQLRENDTEQNSAGTFGGRVMVEDKPFHLWRAKLLLEIADLWVKTS